jgi:hypothetical protein
LPNYAGANRFPAKPHENPYGLSIKSAINVGIAKGALDEHVKIAVTRRRSRALQHLTRVWMAGAS